MEQLVMQGNQLGSILRPQDDNGSLRAAASGGVGQLYRNWYERDMRSWVAACINTGCEACSCISEGHWPVTLKRKLDLALEAVHGMYNKVSSWWSNGYSIRIVKLPSLSAFTGLKLCRLQDQEEEGSATDPSASRPNGRMTNKRSMGLLPAILTVIVPTRCCSSETAKLPLTWTAGPRSRPLTRLDVRCTLSRSLIPLHPSYPTPTPTQLIRPFNVLAQQ